MISNGEFVSRIINGINNLDIDSLVSKRYVLSIGQIKAKFYLSQKLLEKTIFLEPNLFQFIPCIEMISVPSSSCSIDGYTNCSRVMRSKHKIPGLIYYNLGPSIISMSPIDDSFEIVFASPKRFRNEQQRQHFGKFKKVFFYVKDDYIYLLNSEIEYVNLTYISSTEEGIEEIKGSCGSNNIVNNSCKSVWDMNFICPDKLLDRVMDETRAEVFDILRIPKDENPDMDSNIKGTTVV